MKNRGFTLIEMLVVISIMTLLSALLILYSRTGESQLILFKEQARVVSVLNRAKALSIQMFNAPNPPCAFGVNFSPTENSFLIFRDLAFDCRISDNKYSGPDELFERYQLDSRIKFKDLTLTDVVFIPPDPKTLIDNGANKNEAIVVLETSAGAASLKVKINNAGQITTQ
jgi:prepilin-type N-terminal cleavage/methylation domain-containing protein